MLEQSQGTQQREDFSVKKEEISLVERVRYAASIGLPLTTLLELMHGGTPGFLIGALVTGGAAYFSDDLKRWKERHFSKSSSRSSSSSSSLTDLGWWFHGQVQDDVQSPPFVQDLPHVSHAPVAKEAAYDFDRSDEEDLPPSTNRGKKDLFIFSELLDAGFVPTVQKIFVGRTGNGKDIFVAAEDLCHVAIAGKTGGGKGSIMRLIMVQLCYIGVRVLLLNPHYMRWVIAKDGPLFDEDWTPFEGEHPRMKRPYLEVSPLECADFDPIEERLIWIIQELLQHRKQEGREGGKRFRPYFIVLDEWPSLASKIKDAPSSLADLLREGRKYGIFVIVASQDFQVKTIGMDGGSIRKCLLTCFYTGGDNTTAKELLYTTDIPEKDLGKGKVMLRCTGTENTAVLVQVPFVDNEALYRLLGTSTFDKKRLSHSASDVRDEESVIPSPLSPPIAEEENSLLDTAYEIYHPRMYQHPHILAGRLQIPPAHATRIIEQLRKQHYIDKQGKKIQTSLPPTFAQGVRGYYPHFERGQQSQEEERKRRMAEDIDLARAIKLWNTMHPSIKDMESIFDLVNNQARRLRKMIKEHSDAEAWDAEEEKAE